MKAIYIAAWLSIVGFLGWSGNLLLNIQSLWSQSNVLHTLRTDLDALTSAWRDLSRPGNDVLENYEVAPQRTAFEIYARSYQGARDIVLQRVRDDPELAPFIQSLEAQRETLSGLAREILHLAQQREDLRLARGEPESIRAKETLATSKMARMDQAFQDGLDQLLKANEAVIAQEQGLEAIQHRNFHRLYVMLLFALVASALSVELVRRTMRQREALREGAARINAIVNNVVDGIVTVDEQGHIESINPTASAMFGDTGRELMGRAFTQLLDESCRDAYRERLRQGAHGLAPTFGAQECEALGRRRDGSTFPMELAASQVMVEGRRLLIHIVRDITERRRADEKLRLAASVFENTTEGIMVTDARGTIQSVNPAFTTITQYRAQEVIGQNPSILKSGRQDQGFYQHMWASIRETGHWQGETWNRRKNGEIYPQWLTVSAIKGGQGRVTNYVGVTWDISELKASERLKEEFIATVSHELRTPLTSVLGSLGLIVGEVAGQVPERVQKLVQIAYNNSERLVRLISDILDIEKMEAGKMGFRFQASFIIPQK
jgi:PAS domain S-box-containing protein